MSGQRAVGSIKDAVVKAPFGATNRQHLINRLALPARVHLGWRSIGSCSGQTRPLVWHIVTRATSASLVNPGTSAT